MSNVFTLHLTVVGAVPTHTISDISNGNARSIECEVNLPIYDDNANAFTYFVYSIGYRIRQGTFGAATDGEFDVRRGGSGAELSLLQNSTEILNIIAGGGGSAPAGGSGLGGNASSRTGDAGNATFGGDGNTDATGKGATRSQDGANGSNGSKRTIAGGGGGGGFRPGGGGGARNSNPGGGGGGLSNINNNLSVTNASLTVNSDVGSTATSVSVSWYVVNTFTGINMVGSPTSFNNFANTDMTTVSLNIDNYRGHSLQYYSLLNRANLDLISGVHSVFQNGFHASILSSGQSTIQVPSTNVYSNITLDGFSTNENATSVQQSTSITLVNTTIKITSRLLGRITITTDDDTTNRVIYLCYTYTPTTTFFTVGLFINKIPNPEPSIGGVYAQKDDTGAIVNLTDDGSVTEMHWKGTQTITFDIDNITDDTVIGVGYNPSRTPSNSYSSIANIEADATIMIVSYYTSGTGYNSSSNSADHTYNPTGDGYTADFTDMFTLQKNVLQIKSNSIQHRDFGIFVFNKSTTYDYIGKLGIDIEKFNNSPVLDETTISLSVEVNKTITYLLGASKEFDEVINFHFSETSTFDDDWVAKVISGENRVNCGQELTLSNGDKVSIAKDSNLMTFECNSSDDISFNYWANDGYYGHYIGGTYTTYSPQSSMGTITVTKFQAPTEAVENIVIYMPSNLTRTTIVFPSGFTTYEISGGTYTDITSSLPTLTNGTLTSNTSSSIHFKPIDLTMRTTTFDYKVTNAAGVATIKDVTIFSGASGFKDGSDNDLADKYSRLSSGSGVTTNYQSNGVDLGSIFEAKDSPTSGGTSPYTFTISGTTYKFDEYFEPIPS